MAHTNQFQTYDPGGKRVYKFFQDQHGRRWGCLTEGKDMHPVGTMEPKFWSPWLPPLGTKYMKVDISPEAFQGQLIHLYPVILSESLEAHRLYEQKAIEECTARGWNEDLSEVVDAKRYSPQLRHILGPLPLPWQPIKAAMDGNPWILGETRTPDIRLVPFVIVERPNVTIALENFGPEPEPEVPDAPSAVVVAPKTGGVEWKGLTDAEKGRSGSRKTAGAGV